MPYDTVHMTVRQTNDCKLKAYHQETRQSLAELLPLPVTVGGKVSSSFTRRVLRTSLVCEAQPLLIRSDGLHPSMPQLPVHIEQFLA